MADEATGPEDGEAGEEQESESSQEEQKEQQEEESSQEAEAPWRGDIKDEKARKFAEQFTTISDMAVGALGLRQKLSNAVNIPGDDATSEEIAEFNEKMGVPAEASGYEIVLPEGLELSETEQANMAAFTEAMHAKGARPEVVQAAFDVYMGMQEANQKSRTNQLNEKAAASDQELSEEWGEDNAKNTNLSKAAAQTWGGDEFVQFLRTSEVDGYALGDHPMMRRVFAVIGRRMTEDGVHLGPVGEQRSTIQEKIDKITEEHYGKPSYSTDRIQNELQGLYKQLEGDAPIVGSAGRSV